MKYYCYASGKCNFKTVKNENYPLTGKLVSTKRMNIERIEGNFYVSEDSFYQENEIFFYPNDLEKTKEVLGLCIKNLPECLRAEIKSEMYLSKEGEEEPSDKTPVGEMTIETVVQLKQWDAEREVFTGVILKRYKM